MNLIKKIAPVLMLGGMLCSCSLGGKPALCGKALAFESLTYNFVTGEEENFASENHVGYDSFSAFTDDVKSRLIGDNKGGTTSDNKIHFGDVVVGNNTSYREKEITIYSVNEREVSEYEKTSRCHFGLDPVNKSLYHFYDAGHAINGKLIVDLYNICNPKSYSSDYSYECTTFDNGMTFSKDVLTMNLQAKFSVYDGDTVQDNFVVNLVLTYK